MGAPLLLAAGIAAGGNLLGQGINAAVQGAQNKKQMRFAQKMYEQQRRDSLLDTQMANQYNSPQAQMDRLKAAGLNPNLVYGNGTVANQAELPRQTQQPNWQPKPISMDLGSPINQGLSTFYNLQQTQAQTDNLKAQNDVLLQDKFLKAAQTINTLSTNETQQFDLGLKQEIKDYSVEAAKLGVEQQAANITTTFDANERAAAQNASTLKEAAERILSMRLSRAKTYAEIDHIKETITHLRKTNVLSDLEAELKRQQIDLRSSGLLEGDSLIARLLKKLLDGKGIINSPSLPGSTGSPKADSIMRNMRLPGIPRNLPLFK